MIRKITSLLISIALSMLLSMSVFANVATTNEFLLNSEGLAGTIHEDGSYQLSEEELSRFNAYTNQKDTYNVGEAFEYAAPQFYNRLSDTAKDVMKNTKYQNSTSKAANSSCHSSAWLSGTSTTISKYGSSIKSVSSIDRTAISGAPASVAQYIVINEIYSSSGQRVGASTNVSLSSKVSTTTIVDPPSGNYQGKGWYQVPWNCTVCFQWTAMTSSGSTGFMSYVNPYQ